MRVEVLVVPGCPHRDAAVALVRGLLAELRLTDVAVRVGVIDTTQEAQQRGFAGSPTILINGVDPFARPDHLAALACRMYPTRTGTGPLPDTDALRRFLRAAATTTDTR